MLHNPLRIGIVGCGRVARTAHFSAIAHHHELFALAGVADCELSRANEKAKEFQVPAFSSLESLLKEIEVDIVSICVPNGYHTRLGLEAAKAGKHLIVEKPLAMTIEDADRLIDACENEGVKLFSILQNRYNETTKLLKACIDKGRFGRITSCNVTVSWRRGMPYYLEDHRWRSRRDLAGGVFTNQCVHFVDIMQWLVGAPPESVYAKMGTIHPVDVEDHGAGIIKFKNGVIGTLVLTNHAFPQDVEGSVTVIGEKGMVKLGGKSMNKIDLWSFSSPDVEDELIRTAESSPPTVYGFGHLEMYRRVGLYLLTGVEEEQVIDGREGRKSVALLHALYESDRTGQEVRFPIGKR